MDRLEAPPGKHDMIDTHLHILPGVDDGPEMVQESLQLAHVLVQEDIRAAIATPHYKDPTRLAFLRRQGVLAQSAACGLIGIQGNRARRTAANLHKRGLIQCIASDAHGLHKRSPGVARGLQRATELLGQERVYQMVEILPAAILNNELYSLAPEKNNYSSGE